jgi:hypothetical protein
MASSKIRGTRSKAKEEAPPSVRQQIAELQTALKGMSVYGRNERHAVEMMMAQLGKFQALLYLWGRGH